MLGWKLHLCQQEFTFSSAPSAFLKDTGPHQGVQGRKINSFPSEWIPKMSHLLCLFSAWSKVLSRVPLNSTFFLVPWRFTKKRLFPQRRKKCSQLFSATAASLSFHPNVLVLWLSGWYLRTSMQPLTRVCIPSYLGSVPRLPFPSPLAHYCAHVMMLGCPARRSRREISLSIQGIFLTPQSSF